MKKEDHTFIKRINTVVPTEDNKVVMIATLLGSSGVITEFLAKNFPLEDIPIEILYACSIVSANMLSIISDEKKIEIIDLSSPEDEYIMGEQTQERVRRKFVKIIKLLYQLITEEEKGLPVDSPID